MFNPKNNIVSAIEIGTSKISVLIGRVDEDLARPELIGFGSVPSAGSVVKGEISNMEEALTRLSEALEVADKGSGGELCNSCLSVVTVTGAGISASHSIGTVFIKNSDQRSELPQVTDRDCEEAHSNALNFQKPDDRKIISSSESRFVLDGNRPVREPRHQRAHKLDAYICIISGVTNRVENFRSLVCDTGLSENNILPVFSGTAAAEGILSQDEQERGVLLVDFGGGTVEYVVAIENRLSTCGVIQVGFDHVLNDLSIGLNVPIGVCRAMMENGEIQKLFTGHQAFWELPSNIRKARKIPMSSVETILDARLREIFGIIRKRLQQEGVLNQLDSAVLTGGGALFGHSSDIFKSVFGLPLRVGQPLDAGEELENPRFSTAWGALKVASQYSGVFEDQSGRGFGGLFNGLDGMVSRVATGLKDIWGSFKV